MKHWLVIKNTKIMNTNINTNIKDDKKLEVETESQKWTIDGPEKFDIGWLRFYKIKKVSNPEYKRGNCGIDFFIPTENEYKILVDGEEKNWNTASLMINPGSNIKIPTGLKVDIPEGLALQIINKSGVALKKGLLVGASLIDSSYKGEFNFHFINSTSKQCFISKGEKICQAVIINDYIGLWEKDKNSEIHKRGENGFGSTGDGLTKNK